MKAKRRLTALMLAAMMLLVSMPVYAATGRQEGVTASEKYYTMTWNVNTTRITNTVQCANAMGVAAIIDAYYADYGEAISGIPYQRLGITVRSEPGTSATCVWSAPVNCRTRYANFYGEVDYNRCVWLLNVYP